VNVQRRRRDARGFSLIELLIVIAILGVLAAIVTFAVGGFSGAGEQEACKTDKRSLTTALEAYKNKYGGYPVVSAPAASHGQQALVTDEFIVDVSAKYNYVATAQSQSIASPKLPPTPVLILQPAAPAGSKVYTLNPVAPCT